MIFVGPDVINYNIKSSILFTFLLVLLDTKNLKFQNSKKSQKIINLYIFYIF